MRLGRYQEFSFGHIKFEVYVRYQVKMSKRQLDMNLESGEKVWA